MAEMTEYQEKVLRTFLEAWIDLKVYEGITNKDLQEMVTKFIPSDRNDEKETIDGRFPRSRQEKYAIEHLLRMLQVPEIEEDAPVSLPREKIVLSYEEHINTPDAYSNEYAFIADLCDPFFWNAFVGMDNNHDVADLLRENHIFISEDGSQDDPEASCYYAYFKTEDAARGFIERLNVFLSK